MTVSEYEVFEAMKNIIVSTAGNYYGNYKYGSMLSALTSKLVTIGFPDIDNLPGNVSVYINPDFGSMEPLTLGSDQETQTVVLSIFCKGASPENLVKYVFGYYTAIWHAVIDNPSLGGVIDGSRVTDWDYFPQVGLSKGTTCIEVSVELTWQKAY